MSYERVILDLESNSFLDVMLDFSKKPLRFKEDSTIWCVSLRCIDTNQSKMLVRPDLLDVIEDYASTIEDNKFLNIMELLPLTKEVMQEQLANCVEIVAHSGIKFDFPALKLAGLLDYTVGYPYIEDIDNTFKTSSTLFGKDVLLTDTLLWSKLLNADRYGGHSLASFGASFGNNKIDFTDFGNFSVEMLIYCDQDTSVNRDIYFQLNEEKEDYAGWELPYLMEAKLADISLNQELFGFDYDSDLSEKCKVELDSLLKERYDQVTPDLPPRPLLKSEEKFYTPPKVKFSESAKRISVAMTKFFDKIGADFNPIDETYVFEGRTYDLYSDEIVKKFVPADIKDLDHLKSFLITLGWVPSQWNVRDLTKDSKKKPLTPDKFLTTVDRYVEGTFEGFFRAGRLRELELPANTTPDMLRTILIDKYSKDRKRSKSPIRVPTSPPLKVGATKELCPNLQAMTDQIPFIKAVTEFFTFQHRRNSISGNVDDESGEANSGFESYLRVDGRVSTPVDTLATNTSRMAHREICNIPRIDSIYGGKIRALFGSGKDHLQLGFDFSSLEARIQGHYCIPYTDGAALAETLVASKPNDIHTLNGEKLGISRGDAKAISYACVTGDTLVYSHQVSGWIPISRIKPGTHQCVSLNTSTLTKDYFTDIEAVHEFDDKEVFELKIDDEYSIKCTDDHRWFVLDHDDNKYKFVETKDYFDGDYSVIKTVDGIDNNMKLFKFLSKESLGIQKTYCLTTSTGTFFMEQNGFSTMTGNCLYGASPGKLCKMLSLSPEGGEQLYKDYWDALPALKELREKVELYWESTGNKFILGIDGRRLMARSKHSLLNLLFQGGGSIAVKYSLVFIAQRLEEIGLFGDVFEDTEEEAREKVYSMIMYHDEAQYAMPLSEFKCSYFDSEESALEYIGNKNLSTNPHYSEKMEKYYVVDQNRLTDSIQKAIQDAITTLHVKVELGMEYEVGKTWADCH